MGDWAFLYYAVAVAVILFFSLGYLFITTVQCSIADTNGYFVKTYLISLALLLVNGYFCLT
ncbi:hypothetical protein FIV46_00400 [Emcibacter nanhaiensis]|uniref:Uncharacterized protein n=1 Tax=Emcibacter nanhaiensis TaxID=1505037 RepID=A0A501PR23_9PROT|nr:hypothetical protein FIV46_00400 [Emcibacter nanhaiensis]